MSDDGRPHEADANQPGDLEPQANLNEPSHGPPEATAARAAGSQDGASSDRPAVPVESNHDLASDSASPLTPPAETSVRSAQAPGAESSRPLEAGAAGDPASGLANAAADSSAAEADASGDASGSGSHIIEIPLDSQLYGWLFPPSAADSASRGDVSHSTATDGGSAKSDSPAEESGTSTHKTGIPLDPAVYGFLFPPNQSRSASTSNAGPGSHAPGASSDDAEPVSTGPLLPGFPVSYALRPAKPDEPSSAALPLALPIVFTNVEPLLERVASAVAEEINRVTDQMTEAKLDEREYERQMAMRAILGR